ncbi:PAS domain-containing hybrid sensor histidine kinase/response regulator [Lacisediminimonas profundi]|uniref:PAS domain-containing hybrid sensor histidine kinase/response regulator n=1 Tax=Lacisediminimonas profundi TaxID=2603856 RepID=UPI001F4F38AB|nr:ATP-binding protein [Lacisediminimonas profundi]
MPDTVPAAPARKLSIELLMFAAIGATLLVLLLVAFLALKNEKQPSPDAIVIQASIFLLFVFFAVLAVPVWRRIRALPGGVLGLQPRPLLQAGALQHAIFNSINFSLIATDARGVIRIFNPGAERMLGYAAAEVIDKITPAGISDADELVARAEALSLEWGSQIEPGLAALVYKASRGIEDIYELTYIRNDGTRFPAIVSATALRSEEGNIIGYLLIGTDNTARKRVEARQAVLDQRLRDQQHALQQNNIELEAARAAAEKANLAKSEFLSSMSHELRTPLNAILGFAQLMESDTPPPSSGQQQSIIQILQAGWYLLRLINEILDLAMIESGKVTISQESMSLTDVLEDCQAMFEPQAQKRGIQMHFPRLHDPIFVHADRTRVKQVMINLLSNAIKYNRMDGTVTVECNPAAESRIRVSVRDTGAGLAPEQLAQLFQPFNRLGQQASTEEGTGIGLVVTKQLVELMGGAIGVESTVGGGSLFWIELPVSTAPELVFGADHMLPVGADLAPSLPAGQQRTLLYVEDNPANLALVEQLIGRRSDLKLLTATDGHMGIAIAQGAQPDVILMDIHLPGISGFGALKALRADPATADIPVIALSANAVPSDIKRGMDAGFFRYLTKPIKVVELMEALDVVLENTGEDRRSAMLAPAANAGERRETSMKEHDD